jgi:hypothetical protein
MVTVMSGDGKLETFNICYDTQLIYKKIVRIQKRKNLKRKKHTNEETKK